ncbi:hypothetical protein [Bauldia litoralis]|uniref:Uncharacterized protein n=1 Tax=Bauldia litoralis TaxID=665467 RepID=A0A1G6ECE8_9HYPH|nr:hypothetical protein [Bauldia litoralis]SDB55052.1 hypothetical protein SAMN02982931_04366 [Bauldia litoralis]
MTGATTAFDTAAGRWPWSRLARQRFVLLAGSAPDVVALRDRDLGGLTAVAVNNAWRIRDDFDYVVFPRNFPDENRPPEGYRGALVREINYLKHVASAGGLLFCGSTMAFNAGYWAVRYLKPALIGFSACDMIYDDDDETHFYGKGEADPLRDNLTLRSLEAKSARLFAYALAAGSLAVNFSTRPRSRLVFPRLPLEATRNRSAMRRVAVEARRSAEGRAILDAAQRTARMEAAPPFDVDPNNYWALVGDAAATEFLDKVDRQWLELVPHIETLSGAIDRRVSAL